AHRPVGGDGKAVAGEELLFAQAVPADVQHLRRRVDRPQLGDRGERLGRDVLELEGDHVHAGGKAPGRVEVVVGGDDLLVGDLAGGAVVGRVEGVNAVAHAAGGDGEHAAELPAAEDADGAAGANDG